MSVDLSPTLDLHRRILSELELREAATKEQETEARRALDNALQSIAAERRAIKQCRDLLTQAATLYKSFVGKDRVTTQSDVPQPTEAPVTAAAPELTVAPAVAGNEPSPLATEAPAPHTNVPLPTELPVAVAAPELTPAPAIAEPGPLATEAPAPHTNVPLPTELPMAVAAPELTPAPAIAEPLPLATEAPAPDANVEQPTEVSAAAPEQAFEPAVAGEEQPWRRKSRCLPRRLCPVPVPKRSPSRRWKASAVKLLRRPGAEAAVVGGRACGDVGPAMRKWN